MENFKIVWLYNPTDGNKLMGTKIVDPDYKLGDGETLVTPTDGLYEPIRFDLSAQSWVGITKEEWEKAQPAPVQKPTAQQEFNAATNVQIAQMMAQNKQQAQLNAKLTIDVATLNKQLSQLTKPANNTTAQ
ncbi:hypothetical protein PS395_07200 [Limosilactobacillus pontis]|uniref:hypothetical protein n=1 Tax=Limosilactobacillus pontis TaxID=35787 RepID=UPI002F26CEEB